jgi:hypothetical protein
MKPDRQGRLDIDYAALEGRVQDLCALLAHGENPGLPEKAGFTPLDHAPAAASASFRASTEPGTRQHFAAQQDQVDAAKVLLQGGANLEGRNVYGNTPLWVALMNVRDEVGSVVRLLLEEGHRRTLPMTPESPLATSQRGLRGVTSDASSPTHGCCVPAEVWTAGGCSRHRTGASGC